MSVTRLPKIFSPSQSVQVPRQYNAATWFIDRHPQQGRGDKVALIHDEGETTYGQLADLVVRAGQAMVGLGLHMEQRVALILPDGVDFPVVFWGAMRAGLVPVPLNTMLSADDYLYMLQDSRARLAVVSPDHVDKILLLMDQLPFLTHLLVSGPNGSWRDCLAGVGQGNMPAAAPTTCDDVAFWLYSSGSTGQPKAAMHPHRDLPATAELYACGVLGMTAEDRVFSVSKLFFAYGLGNSLTFPLHVGATAVLMGGRPSVDLVQQTLDRSQPTLFFAVPTLFAAILAASSVSLPTTVRLTISAGEALPADVARRWRSRFAVPILDGLGSTEMLHIFLSNRPDQVNDGSSGFPVPGYEVRIVDDHGHDVAPGELGELIVRGPSSAIGYWNQRDKSKRTFRGDWTYTGDKYARHADGSYHFAGRSDDMLKVGGIWVSPFEVETALTDHPAVLEAAVIGQPDDQGMIKPKAYVVLMPGQVVSQDDLKAHVKQTLAAWKYPRWIEFVTELPKTASGKIQRFRLR